MRACGEERRGERIKPKLVTLLYRTGFGLLFANRGISQPLQRTRGVWTQSVWTRQTPRRHDVVLLVHNGKQG